ncbi:peptidase, M16 family protein [Cognataquiflexum rubidum]|uniref:peptidase, M16 family protein n=1 Tax=Cognataquiflexum rubidum TaxID=2922273 RepID=UPI001F130975|nr:peptidase, M16 family protein [Cognataquiflexum rubidum]MCH6232309.1 peptidase, M16 family protein [Cognataquiflexum rubidum]
MKKIFVAALALGIILTGFNAKAYMADKAVLAATTLVENDPTTIIDNYIKAVGGKANVSKIKNSVLVMEADFQGNAIVIRGISDQENGRMLQETSVMGNVAQKTVLANGKGKMSGMGQEQELTEEMVSVLKSQTYVFPEMHYIDLGYVLEAQGTEKIDEEDAYKLIITAPNGMKTVEYYSVSSGLKLRTSSDATGEISYLDYTEIEGVKVPTKLAIKNPMLPVTLEAKMVSMKFNQVLSDEDFK